MKMQEPDPEWLSGLLAGDSVVMATIGPFEGYETLRNCVVSRTTKTRIVIGEDPFRRKDGTSLYARHASIFEPSEELCVKMRIMSKARKAHGILRTLDVHNLSEDVLDVIIEIIPLLENEGE